MNSETIITIVAVIFIITSLVLLYKYKKEYLQVIAYYAVIQAEDYYKNGNGKKKLQMAIADVKSKIPKWLSWLISDKAITYMIESALATLQTKFKSDKNEAIDNLNKIIGVATDTTSIPAVVQTATDLKNGYVEGYAEAKTDLHGNNSATVGVRGGYKF